MKVDGLLYNICV